MTYSVYSFLAACYSIHCFYRNVNFDMHLGEAVTY